jgi:uncharacterized surface protein with fasciclin (FAS1) repeats
MFGRMSRGLFVAVLALAFGGWAAAQQPEHKKPEAKRPEVKPQVTPLHEKKEGENLFETAKEAKLTTFTDLIKLAGLERELEGPMHMTVFAPTDEALKEYPGLADLKKPEKKFELAEFLKGHIVAKKVDVKKDKMAKPLYGAEIMLTEKEGKTLVNDKIKVAKELTANNGMIYVIDGVIAPAARHEVKPEAKKEMPKPTPKPEPKKPGEKTH